MFQYTEFWLYEAFSTQMFDWLISNEILTEYEEQLSDFYSPKFAEPYFKWALIEADPDDNKFADLAISANANYLVTHDRHFRVLDNIPFPSVAVVDIPQFQSILFPDDEHVF